MCAFFVVVGVCVYQLIVQAPAHELSAGGMTVCIAREMRKDSIRSFAPDAAERAPAALGVRLGFLVVRCVVCARGFCGFC